MNVEVVKLMNAEGIGREKAKRLIDKFGSYEGVKSTPQVELQDVHGIGPVLSWRISPTQNLLPSQLTEENDNE